MFLLLGSIGFNVYNIWLKHAPEYARRAAPTTQLIAELRRLDTGVPARELPALRVCQFPLHWSIGVEVVRFFTDLTPENVVFSEKCDATAGVILRWDKNSERYTTQLLLLNQPQPDVSARTR